MPKYQVGDIVICKDKSVVNWFKVYHKKKEDFFEITDVTEEVYYLFEEDEDGYEIETDEVESIEIRYELDRKYWVGSHEISLVETRSKEQQIIDKINFLWNKQEYVKNAQV